MNALSRNTLLAAVAGLLCTAPASAQRLDLQFDATPNAALAASPDQKNPTVAGLLSLWIPGVGSFYAGNTRHGVIHLGLYGVGWSLLLGGAAIPENCSGTCQGPYGAAAIAGLVILPVNWVWSIFTAVDDVHAHNRAANATEHPVTGNLYFSPEIRSLGVEQTGRTRRIGAQAFTWRF